MTSLAPVRIYIAIRRPEDRSHIEDELVLDGSSVGSSELVIFRVKATVGLA
jgi:hypothetical protein